MTASALPDPSRRRLLRLGLLGTALLAGAGGIASLSSSRQSPPAAGYLILRAEDLQFLQALAPVILAGAWPAADRTQIEAELFAAIDDGLARVSPAMLQQIRQLFDVVASPLTRGPLTGVWQAWADTPHEQVQAFLLRWRDSALDLLRQGHNALLQMVLMAWYGNPRAWAHCGYPGPPPI